MTTEDAPPPPDSVETAQAQAAHLRSAMESRRAIGLKVVVGIVGFELAVLKLAIDAAGHVKDHNELASTVRLITVAAFVVVAGMLTQIEIRTRRNRVWYVHAERCVEAFRKSKSLADIAAIEVPNESFWLSVRNSWATTWPLLGIAVLTVAIWILVGSLR